MAITINRVKNERGVKLGTLDVGDTFLYDNRIGVIVGRNGHCFPLDLTTCGDFRRSTRSSGELSIDDVVLPIDIEISYKVVG